ncbi:asparaginase [Niallia nealsonii]|uniref:L-asparaginase n=1 Tax=Niallia nealsonii TaxID=115979 RepID=A0A2N0Z5L0_9BACI|nr:asparaginase [Niallia nealsonii]PKG24789.1 L-asparaginase [Niallia nealsonii]
MTNRILVYRGEYVESTHNVHIAIVNKEGELLYFCGDPHRLTFPRSAMKPFQAVPLVETGTKEAFNYSVQDLALSCASHAGEDFHREHVLAVLKRIGLNEEALQCGTHTPWNIKSYKKLLQAGKDITSVYHNCSGKHSSMLATAVHMKEDIHTYREVNHPAQQRILAAIADICEVPKESIGLSVDGCGVPVHQLPLDKAALGYAKLAQPEQTAGKNHAKTLVEIRKAMMEYPEMVAGTNRFDTDIMKAYDKKVVAKVGAEAVQCLGLIEKGIGIAIKVEDGSTRAVHVASMEVLNQLGMKDDQIFDDLSKYVQAPVYNARREAIGVIKADFILQKA